MKEVRRNQFESVVSSSKWPETNGAWLKVVHQRKDGTDWIAFAERMIFVRDGRVIDERFFVESEPTACFCSCPDCREQESCMRDHCGGPQCNRGKEA